MLPSTETAPSPGVAVCNSGIVGHPEMNFPFGINRGGGILRGGYVDHSREFGWRWIQLLVISVFFSPDFDGPILEKPYSMSVSRSGFFHSSQGFGMDLPDLNPATRFRLFS